VPQEVSGYLCCLDGVHLLRPGKYFAILWVNGLSFVPNTGEFLSNTAVLEHLPYEVNISSNIHNLLEGNGDFPFSGKEVFLG